MRGLVAGQAFTDALADRALGAAETPGLEAILRSIAEARDYADLRRRILELFPEIDFSRLASLLEAGLTLAELAGQLAQRQDSGLDG